MKNIPYIDLHCHLDGSITLDIARKLAELQNIELPADDAELESKISVPESCESLKDIYFAGTQQKWNQMLIYEDEAEGEMEIELGLDDNVTVHYNYVPTTLSITSHPANVTAKAGDSVSFSVKAEGEGLTYQWYYKKAGQTSFSAWNGRTHASETVTPNESWNGIQL